MHYVIEPKIETIDPKTDSPAYVAEVKRIAQLLEAQVSWDGMPHQVENDETMIYVTTLTPLTEEQKHWFRTAPELHVCHAFTQTPCAPHAESADPAPAISCPLTRRERDVLAQIATGASTKETAHTFGVSDQTVKNQLGSILSKLHVPGRTAAVVFALKNGWIPMPEQFCHREHGIVE